MTKRPFITKGHRTKECLEFVHTDMYRLLKFMHEGGMSTTSLLVMITLGLDMCMGNPMPWINSLNLRRNRITYWINISSHFNWIEAVCLVRLILSIGA